MNKISVIGSGTMGLGIAQLAALNFSVVVIDNVEKVLKNSKTKLKAILNRLVEKNKIDKNTAENIFSRINFTTDLKEITGSILVIEAIIEDLEIKKALFKKVETIVSDTCVLATNTSSLSVTSVASSCVNPNRVIGIHFFNPAPIMPLVEIIPAIQTDEKVVNKSRDIINSFNKIVVLAKDTPGFIVNRVARPFYGEAIRIMEENIANVATIDWAMKELGGFRMGPFELMDFIGNDVNYAVTESVFKAFFYDPRYKPSFTQKRMCEAHYLGRKTNKGYYDYNSIKKNPKVIKDEMLGQEIFWRILVMLINEAADALFLNIASKEDIDLAMKKGVNYPKGLLQWADEIGLDKVLNKLESLHKEYGEDRYRPSPLLRKLIKQEKSFY